jgi:UDP-N-acetylmuramoyl-L-alanyl-D-glutamate--2,6-diaminopimelate ligase
VVVTGTNGKTTVCALLAAIMRQSGRTAIVAGNTFSGPPLSEARSRPGDVVVAELSSFQLESSPQLLPDAAVFTNLSQDHYGYHGGPRPYAAAKRRLFVRGDRSVALAAVNADDPEGVAVAAAVEERGGEAVRYGWGAETDVRLLDARWTGRESEVTLLVRDEQVCMRTRLPGPHNASNVAAAIAIGEGLGIGSEYWLPAIETCRPVPGRLEPVAEGQDFELLVDYAHNAAGVRAVVETIRGAGRRGAIAVISVLDEFTDESQRRAMGRELAAFDAVFVSLERKSPAESRTDPPDGLLDGIRDGGGAPVVIPDRRAAIARALEHAGPGDTVALMGRGPLSFAMLDEHDHPYQRSDIDLARAVVREAAAH